MEPKICDGISYHRSFFCGIGWLKCRPSQKNTKTSNTSGQE